MKNLQNVSASIMDHILYALDYSAALKKENAGPAQPFAIIVKGASKTIQSFSGDTPDYADKMFHQTICTEDPDFIVYATDSFITQNGTRYDAVLFRAYAKNDEEIYILAQKYEPDAGTGKLVAMGSPGFLGTEKNSYILKEGEQSSSRKFWWQRNK